MSLVLNTNISSLNVQNNLTSSQAGRPLDGMGELRCTDRVSLTGEPLSRLMRRAIRDPLDVSVRSINALLSVGGGQRIGLALSQHLKSLDAARKEYEKRRALWSEKRTEAESLNRVIDRFRKEERHAADGREQREGDDAAMRWMLAARTDTGNA